MEDTVSREDAPPPGRRPRTAVAWVAILVLTALVAFLQQRTPGDPEASLAAARAMLRLQARHLVGSRDLMAGLGSVPQDQALLEQARALETGPAALRMRAAVLLAELGGPAEGLESLDRLEALLGKEGRSLEPPDADAVAALRRLWEDTGSTDAADGDTEPVPGEDRQALGTSLDWFGELAISRSLPPGQRTGVMAPARRTSTILLGALAVFLALLALGVAGLVGFAWAGSTGRLRLRLRPPGDHAGILAETFAVWMALYIGLSLLASAAGGSMVLGIASFVLSLGALWWPLFRGVPPQTLLGDLGLHRGEGVLREMAAGAACWVSFSPLVLLAGLVTVVLIALGGDDTAAGPLDLPAGPAHPIIGQLAEGRAVVALVLAATVLAPLVEETLFRGVLYAQLRSASADRGRVRSVLAAALVQGLVFAAVHPQGWQTIPPLCTLGLAFAWAREWRGSLIGPMTAHALNNGLIMVLALLLLA